MSRNRGPNAHPCCGWAQSPPPARSCVTRVELDLGETLRSPDRGPGGCCSRAGRGSYGEATASGPQQVRQMRDEDKTRAELIGELQELRRRLIEAAPPAPEEPRPADCAVARCRAIARSPRIHASCLAGFPMGRLTFASDAYCRYFGKAREDLIGRSVPAPCRGGGSRASPDARRVARRLQSRRDPGASRDLAPTGRSAGTCASTRSFSAPSHGSPRSSRWRETSQISGRRWSISGSATPRSGPSSSQRPRASWAWTATAGSPSPTPSARIDVWLSAR